MGLGGRWEGGAHSEEAKDNGVDGGGTAVVDDVVVADVVGPHLHCVSEHCVGPAVKDEFWLRVAEAREDDGEPHQAKDQQAVGHVHQRQVAEKDAGTIFLHVQHTLGSTYLAAAAQLEPLVLVTVRDSHVRL